VLLEVLTVDVEKVVPVWVPRVEDDRALVDYGLDTGLVPE